MSFDSISSYGNLFGVQNTNAIQAVSRRNSYGASVSASKASGTDSVSISSEAMEKYLAMKNADKTGKSPDVASQVSSWYADFRENMGMVDEPDYSAWPPENMARRQRLIEERDALAPQCSNTIFTEANKKMNGILDSLMALDAVGGKHILSDQDMEKAVGALHSAMDRWEGDVPGTSAYLAGMGAAPSGAELTADGGIMHQASGSASSLKDIYFLNRFPEREEEELFPKEEDEEDENTFAPVNEADSQAEPQRETAKAAMYKLADYILSGPKNGTIIERQDVPAAEKVWIDVPLDVLAAKDSAK